ncbi:MAG TPA: TPM domain-containing protein [Candidatus Binataceae bacterium]|nr:TPM domain-containing protein [Candidatus Binataceae bacterium]
MPAYASEPSFPALTGRVVDGAGVLSESTKSQLTDALKKHEDATGDQVVVVTLDSLQGYTIEDFGYQLGRHWGIGQKGKDNGVLLIVAPSEHKVRIEVGYGLEGTLTDAASRTIIESDILPNFRSDNYDAGVIAGTASILTALGGAGASALSNVPRSERPIRIKDYRSHSRNDVSDVHFLLVMLPFFINIAAFIFLVGYRIRQIPKDKRHPYNLIWGGGTSTSGGLSSSGFSGGGGSFGGGGASGSW